MWEYRFPGGGENLQDVKDRVQPALDRLLEDHEDQWIILVAHNSVNRVILGRALGLSLSKVFDFQQDFGCINVIEYKRRPRVMAINWTADPTGR
jgi:broad specificity phosphatase PhoE